jgi:MazG family protein
VYPLGEPKGAALLDLVATESRLRGPGGCPWDAEQTHATLARNLVEEAYETLDAIDEGDPEHLREELGDLLLQVVFHAQIAEDDGAFDVDAVARGIVEKLVRRHPHVFGDTRADTADEVKRNWDRIKREEEGRADPLAGIPSGLPALQLATKLQKRAADEGFVWPETARPASGQLAKVREELDEVMAAATAEEQAAELGDLLFALAGLARSLRVEPEAALRLASKRFRSRFTRARELAVAAGREPKELSPEEWLDLWDRAKRGD